MPLPPGEPEPSNEDKARSRERLEKMNCGFEKAERLDDNIGYIKFDMFGDPEICGPKATAAFASLAPGDPFIGGIRTSDNFLNAANCCSVKNRWSPSAADSLPQE